MHHNTHKKEKHTYHGLNYFILYHLFKVDGWGDVLCDSDEDTVRLDRALGISTSILFIVLYFIFLTSQRFEVHSHEGSMSNKVTNKHRQTAEHSEKG